MASRPKLPAAWPVFRSALRNYRRNWWRYSVIVGLVLIPVSLINLASGLSSDSSVLAYTSLASLMMNVAILWAIARSSALDRRDWLSGTYYDSSAAALRFVLAALALAVCLLPAVLGLVIYSIGTSGGLSDPTIGERLLIAGLALVIGLPSIWLSLRLGFSLLVVIREDKIRPIRALRLSWQLTRGYAWQLLGRLALGMLLIVLILLAPAIVLLGSAQLLHTTVFSTLFQIIATIIVLPLFNLVAYELYYDLKHEQTRRVSDESQ